MTSGSESIASCKNVRQKTIHSLARESAVLATISIVIIANYWPIISPAFSQPTRTLVNSRLAGLGDTWRFYGPYQFFLDSSLHKDQLPMWNPMLLCGTPFAANPQALVFYPPNLIRSLMTPNPTPIKTHLTLAAMMYMHLILFAGGAYALARLHNLSRVSALVAGLATATPPMVIERVLSTPTHMLSVAWTPLVMVCMHCALQPANKSRIVWAIAAGIVYGVQMLSGFLQIVSYALVLYVIYAVALTMTGGGWPTFRDRSGTGLDAWGKRLQRIAGALAMMGVVGSALAAAMLLPGLEFAQLSNRWGDQGTQAEQGEKFSTLHRCYVLWNHVPPLTSGQKFEQTITILFTPFAGQALCFVLIPFALMERKRKNMFIFCILLYATADLFCGRPAPLATIIQNCAPWSFASSYYATVLCGLPIGLLAGLGLESILIPNVGNQQFSMRNALVVITGVILYFYIPAETLETRYLSMIFGMAILAVILIARMSALSPLLICTLFAMHAAIAGYGQVANYFVSKSNYFLEKLPETLSEELVQSPAFCVDGRRTLQDELFPCNTKMYRLKSAVSGYDGMLLDDTTHVLADVGNTYYRMLDGELTHSNLLVPLFLMRNVWLARHFTSERLPKGYAAFPPTLTAYITEGEVPGIPEMPIGDIPNCAIANSRLLRMWDGQFLASEEIPENRISLGLVAAAGKRTALRFRYACHGDTTIYLELEDPIAAERTILGPITLKSSEDGYLEWPLPDFESQRISINLGSGRNSAVAARFFRIELHEDTTDENALVKIDHLFANRIELQVNNLPGPRMLVYTDSFYPGWKAFVDGEPVSLYRANGAFKAIAVPEGSHKVLMVFRPWRVYVGVAVSLFTAIASFIALVVFVYRRMRDERLAAAHA